MSDATGISVHRLVEVKDSLGLSLRCGSEGLHRRICDVAVQKPGLVLAGLQRPHGDAVHVMGRAENEYLSVRPEVEQREILMDYVRSGVPCVVVCWGLVPCKVLMELADTHWVPLFTSLKPTGEFIRQLQQFLSSELAPKEEVHGVLVQVHDLGILITGDSGIGKSETALELVLRGHRMVADDRVSLMRTGDDVIGSGVVPLGHFMEIRGLGIIHAGDLFGQSAVVENARVDLVVELRDWSSVEPDRTGIDQRTVSILSLDIPHILLPVKPGRNIATIVEVAARNQILRKRGIRSAARYEQLIMDQMKGAGPKDK